MASHAGASELDHWEELGNPGWNWELLLPYYRKSETFIPPTDEQQSLYGKSDASWQPTLKAIGIPTDVDLRVLLKLPTQPGGLAKATGVSFIIDGIEQTISAAKVLLAGGTYMSPKLLQLSGVGPPILLQKFGIDVIVDNPAVGENLQVSWNVRVMNTRSSHGTIERSGQGGSDGPESFRDPKILDWAMNEWINGRGGPLSSGVNGTALLSSQIIAPHVGQPPNFMQNAGLDRDDEHSPFLRKLLARGDQADLQLSFAPIGWNPYEGGEALSRLFTHSSHSYYFAFTAVLARSFSRGTVHIVSPDPRSAPAIDPKYLDHPVDFELMVQGVLFMQKIYETKPLADYCEDLDDGTGKKIQDTYEIPGRIDRKAAEKLVRQGTIPSWHPVGTCAMLPRQRGGVVDPQLKVYGVDSLRAIDASIMPTLVRGNIISAVYAIAEKATDLIKADYKL
ncbi:hypothetical protein ACHAO4_007261 [Trichoderma viride]